MQKKGYPADWLDKLKYNSNIVSTVSRYLTLSKKGATYWACCPFHHEKTPSFAVNEQGQYYHCFGCGETGDVITFVQKLEGLDFTDTVKLLAQNAGIEVPDLVGDKELVEKRKKRELLQQICRESALYYHNNLKSNWGAKALEYLHNRGVTDSTITKLGLGYSSNKQGLNIHLSKLGFSKRDILESGVCAEKDGKLVDEMAFRVVFPVINHAGKVVGFSGRAMNNDAYAKYKNTKTTLIFNKSNNIYCINLLRKARLNNNYAILVEGQMDVVALQQAGFGNAIATMGTAFNKNHVQTLQRFVDEVIICFDGDNAGQMATKKCLEPLLEENLNIKVVEMPEKLDPDEYIKKYGTQSYQNLLDNALPVYEFEIKYLAKKLKISNKENIPKFVDECLKIIIEIKKETEKEIYINLVAKLSGLTRETILRQLANTKIERVEKFVEYNSQTNTQTKNYKAEQFVLASLLHKKPYAQGIETYDFVNNNFKMLYDYLQKNNYPIISKIIDDFNITENTDIKGLIDFDFDAVKNLEKEFFGCITKIRLDRLLEQQEIINQKILACTDEQERFELLKQASEISKNIIEKKTLLNKVG